MDPRLLHVFRLRVAGRSDDHGLLGLALFVEVSNAFGAVVTILNGHVAVHEDQGVRAPLAACVLDHVERILAIEGPV